MRPIASARQSELRPLKRGFVAHAGHAECTARKARLDRKDLRDQLARPAKLPRSGCSPRSRSRSNKFNETSRRSFSAQPKSGLISISCALSSRSSSVSNEFDGSEPFAHVPRGILWVESTYRVEHRLALRSLGRQQSGELGVEA